MPDNAPKFIAWSPADFDAATLVWPIEAVGAYVRLLHLQFQLGELPSDPRTLAGLVRVEPNAFDSLWNKYLRGKFELNPDNPQAMANPRMARERAKAVAKTGGARKAAQARWKKAGARADADANASADVLSNSPSPSSPLSVGESGNAVVENRAFPTIQDIRAASSKALGQALVSKGAPDWFEPLATEWIRTRAEEYAVNPSKDHGLPLTPNRWSAVIDVVRSAGRDPAQEALSQLQANGWVSWPQAAARCATEALKKAQKMHPKDKLATERASREEDQMRESIRQGFIQLGMDPDQI